MSAWETMDTVPGAPPYTVDFARIWQAEKIVYSGTLEGLNRENQDRAGIPARGGAPDQRQRSDRPPRRGCSLAAVALKAVLVDEVHLFVVPMVVGGGKGRSRRIPPEARTARRAPLRQRNGVPSLPHRLAPDLERQQSRHSLDSLSPIEQAHPVGPMRARRPVRPRQSRRPVPTHPPTRPNCWIPTR